jgi:predicted nuclease with TOPRIM domain
MSELRDEIALIKKNAKKLAQLYQSVISERDKLQEENEKLKAEADERGKKLAELENNSINLHISETLKGSTTNRTALKKKLDFFIKEIDACIEHLKA